MRSEEFMISLASQGLCTFHTDDAMRVIGSSRPAVSGQLRRLKVRGLLAEPARGFHVIVSPEYMSLGCLPADQFIDQLMQAQGEIYYVTLLSAAERHGAAHQRPQALQVMVKRNRRPISCGAVRIEFVARADLGKMPADTVNTSRGTLRISTPEVTSLELAGYPDHAGGLSNVATVLSELGGRLNAGRLRAAAELSPVSWAQRLGYLLEKTGWPDRAAALRPLVRKRAWSYTPLRRAAPIKGCTRSADWKLLVNTDVEADT